MNVLALDLATRTGWALYRDGRVESGVQDFTLRRGESSGMRFVAFRKWLTDILLDSGSDDGHVREELAWAAGFYDGEGSTGCYKQTVKATLASGERKTYSSPCLAMGVAQVDRRALDRFHAAIGDGVICGPRMDGRGGNRRPCFSWKLSGTERVKAALERLWPWLGEAKREQALVALDEKICVSTKPHRPRPRFGLVAYEQAHMRGGHATEVLVGMSSIVQELCSTWTAEYTPVHSATLKKFATGSGRASKEDMIAVANGKKAWFAAQACQYHGLAPELITDDNEADAICLLAYALKEILGEAAWNVRSASTEAPKSSNAGSTT